MSPRTFRGLILAAFVLVGLTAWSQGAAFHETFGVATWVPLVEPQNGSRAVKRGNSVYFALSSGLAKYDLSGKQLRVFPLDPNLGIAELRELVEVDGDIWVVTRGSGIYVFDPPKDEIIDHFIIGEKTDFGQDGNMAVFESPSGDAIWFGHFLNVDRYDRKTKKWLNLNGAIARLGIGKPGSFPQIRFADGKVWIENQRHNSSTGQTMVCDSSGESCQVASAPVPAEALRPAYPGCPESAGKQAAVCGDKIVENTGGRWTVLVENLPRLSFPVDRVSGSPEQGPLVACKGNDALITANGGLKRFHTDTFALADVSGGAGFNLDGFWGLERESDDVFQLTKDYDGDDDVPPSKYYSFSWSENRLVALSSGPSAGSMDQPSLFCDLASGSRLSVISTGLRIEPRQGPSATQLRREGDQANALAALNMHEMFPDEPGFNQVAGVQAVLSYAKDDSEAKGLLEKVLETKAGPVAKAFARCKLADIFHRAGDASAETQQRALVPGGDCSTLQQESSPIAMVPQGKTRQEKIHCLSQAQLRLIVVPKMRQYLAAKELAKAGVQGKTTAGAAYESLQLMGYVGGSIEQSLKELPPTRFEARQEAIDETAKTIANDPELSRQVGEHLRAELDFVAKLSARMVSENQQLRNISIYGPKLMGSLQNLTAAGGSYLNRPDLNSPPPECQ